MKFIVADYLNLRPPLRPFLEGLFSFYKENEMEMRTVKHAKISLFTFQ